MKMTRRLIEIIIFGEDGDFSEEDMLVEDDQSGESGEWVGLYRCKRRW